MSDPRGRDFWIQIREKAQALFSKIRGKVQTLFFQIRQHSLFQEKLPLALKGLNQRGRRFVDGLQGQKWTVPIQKLWARIWGKVTDLKNSEAFQAQQQKLLKGTKAMGQKAQELGKKAAPLAQKALEMGQDAKSSLGEKISQAPRLAIGEKRHDDMGDSPRESIETMTSSGLPPWLARILMRLVRIKWLGRLTDWWLTLPLFRSEKLFFRFVLPTLALSSFLLFFAGFFLQVYLGTNLKQTENKIRSEATQELLSQIYERYGNYLGERTAEMTTIVRDNLAKSDLIADAPTFQDLNIQKMEEFSRSLLRKDSNLLNVVVLTQDEVKQAVRTRRIGDTTRFLFTCCELPAQRQIQYREINEPQWLNEIDSRKTLISPLFVSPVNGETYFYLGSNIEDFKGTQNGALLLRYNLNFAIRILQKPFAGGINYLVANDSVVVASSLDTLMPRIEVSLRGDSSAGRKVDYILAVIDLIRRAPSRENALESLRRGNFIEDVHAFQQQFRRIIPGSLSTIAGRDSADSVYRLSQAQAEAILDLSFGQLLGLKHMVSPGQVSGSLSLEEGRILAMAYLDSMKSLGNGHIVDAQYLLTFSTNEFGWLVINQSTNAQYLGPIEAKNEFLHTRFSQIRNRIFWFILITGVFFLTIFLLLITGILYRFTMPVNKLATWVAENRAGNNLEIKQEEGDELAYLERSFTRMNSDLSEYVQKLEASNRDLEQYAHVVAHDLREPLRMVSSYMNLLVNKHRDDFDQDSETFARFAVDGAKRMDRMIRHILEYASLSQKFSQEEWSEVNLAEQVQQALDNLQTAIVENQAVVEVGSLPQIKCKAQFITTVFQNLIENAIKYRQADVIPHLFIRANQQGTFWQIEIEDNGAGITPELQEKAFNMFTQLNPTDGSSSGLGIGLASTRRIIEYIGGKIWVESEGENMGCTFFFTLPVRND